MCLSSAQVRFLGLTTAKHDIECKQQMLSNEKVDLMRDSERVYRDYTNALNKKCLKWSNNAGVDYLEISYANLMRPGAMNLNEPNIITDPQDCVVVDSSYLEYAKMISPDGKAGGDWSDETRANILSALTGIDKQTILGQSSSAVDIQEQYKALNNIASKEPQKTGFTKNNVEDLLKNMTTNVDSNKTWRDAYSLGSNVSLGYGTNAVTKLSSLIDQLKNNLGIYFLDNKAEFEEACESAKMFGFDGTQDFKDKPDSPIQGSSSEGYSANVKAIVDLILSMTSGYADNNGAVTVEWYDINSDKYKNVNYNGTTTDWTTAHAAWEKDYKNAQAGVISAQDKNGQLLTADQEAKIAFYDKLFSTIAENGWVYNDQINDNDYLNELLLNGDYNITRVARSEEYDEDTNSIKRYNNYQTDVATNLDYIYQVADSDARNDATAKYEHEKRIIDKKETRIDTQMKNLDTELSAINQMMEGIQATMKDATDRTFSIFS